MRLGALLLAALAASPLLGAPPKPPVTVAVVDFAVSGAAQPRFWLGPVYSEVLTHRLLRCSSLLISGPAEARTHAATVAPQDVAGVASDVLRLVTKLNVQYAVGGMLEDFGDKLKVTCVVAAKASGRAMHVELETPIEKLFAPQAEVVVKRFLRDMGVRLEQKEYEAMLAYDPATDLPTLELIGKGWRVYAPDDPSESFRLWEQALVAAPNNPLAAEALASTSYLYRRLLLERATKLLEEQSLRDPDNPTVHCHLGQTYLDQSRWPDAEEAFLRAVELRNSFLDGYLGLGTARLRQSKYEQAMAAYEGALVISPNHKDAMHGLAVALYQRGLVPRATEVWRAILRVDPNDALAQRRLREYGRGQP